MKFFHLYLVFVVLLFFFSDCNGQEPEELETSDGPKAPKKGLKRLLRSLPEKVPKSVKAAKDVPIVADQPAVGSSQPAAASSQDILKSSTPNPQDVLPPPSNPVPRSSQPDVNVANGQSPSDQITSQSEPDSNPHPLGTSNPAQPESSNPGNPGNPENLGNNLGTPAIAGGDANASPTVQNEAKAPQAVSTKLPDNPEKIPQEIPNSSVQSELKKSNLPVIVLAVGLVGLAGILGGAFLFVRRRKRTQKIGIEAADAKIDTIVNSRTDLVSQTINLEPHELGTLPRRQDNCQDPVSNPVRDLQNLLELTQEVMKPRHPEQTAITIGELQGAAVNPEKEPDGRSNTISDNVGKYC